MFSFRQLVESMEKRTRENGSPPRPAPTHPPLRNSSDSYGVSDRNTGTTYKQKNVKMSQSSYDKAGIPSHATEDNNHWPKTEQLWRLDELLGNEKQHAGPSWRESGEGGRLAGQSVRLGHGAEPTRARGKDASTLALNREHHSISTCKLSPDEGLRDPDKGECFHKSTLPEEKLPPRLHFNEKSKNDSIFQESNRSNRHYLFNEEKLVHTAPHFTLQELFHGSGQGLVTEGFQCQSNEQNFLPYVSEYFRSNPRQIKRQINKYQTVTFGNNLTSHKNYSGLTSSTESQRNDDGGEDKASNLGKQMREEEEEEDSKNHSCYSSKSNTMNWSSRTLRLTSPEDASFAHYDRQFHEASHKYLNTTAGFRNEDGLCHYITSCNDIASTNSDYPKTQATRSRVSTADPFLRNSSNNASFDIRTRDKVAIEIEKYCKENVDSLKSMECSVVKCTGGCVPGYGSATACTQHSGLGRSTHTESLQLRKLHMPDNAAHWSCRSKRKLSAYRYNKSYIDVTEINNEASETLRNFEEIKGNDISKARPATGASGATDTAKVQEASAPLHHATTTTTTNSLLEFCCRHCSSQWRDEPSLARHQRLHASARPFACPDCPSRFNQLVHLQIHRRTHTGEKPFRCGSCSATFSRKDRLRSHERRHTGAKPYSCPYCSVAFPNAASLRAHLSAHTHRPPFTCRLCHATFAHLPTFTSHWQLHT